RRVAVGRRLNDEAAVGEDVARTIGQSIRVGGALAVRIVVLPQAMALAAHFGRSSRIQSKRLHDRRVAARAQMQRVTAGGAAIRLHVTGGWAMAAFARDAELGGIGVDLLREQRLGSPRRA